MVKVDAPLITPAIVKKIMNEYGLTEAVVTDIYAKLRHGAKIIDITKVYNIPYDRAARIAHELGFKFKTSVTEELEQAVIELRKQGLTYKEISEKLGIGETSVWQILRKHGLTGINKYQEIEPKVVKLRKQGYTYRQIAEELGISKDRVWKILRKHGLINTSTKDNSIEQRIVELRKQGYTYRQIAKELGVSMSKIHKVLMKYKELGEEPLRKPKEIVIDVPEDNEEEEEDNETPVVEEETKEEKQEKNNIKIINLPKDKIMDKLLEDTPTLVANPTEEEVKVEIETGRYRIKIITTGDLMIEVKSHA